jgi:hypothetical protein
MGGELLGHAEIEKEEATRTARDAEGIDLVALSSSPK